jgi:hypothetical protein
MHAYSEKSSSSSSSASAGSSSLSSLPDVTFIRLVFFADAAREGLVRWVGCKKPTATQISDFIRW